MAKKPTTRKKTRKSSAKKSTARKPRARPTTKSKRVRVDGAVAALDEVLTGLGAERADAIRHRVRAVLNSFR